MRRGGLTTGQRAAGVSPASGAAFWPTLVLCVSIAVCPPPARSAGSVRIMSDVRVGSSAELDRLYRQIVAVFPPRTPLALRCLLGSGDFRSGRTAFDLEQQSLCDFIVNELEARGLGLTFPSTSERGPGEEGVLMIVEPLPAR